MLRTELRFYEAKDKANKFSIYWIKQERKSFTKEKKSYPWKKHNFQNEMPLKILSCRMKYAAALEKIF